jgi:hypothetical protein
MKFSEVQSIFDLYEIFNKEKEELGQSLSSEGFVKSGINLKCKKCRCKLRVRKRASSRLGFLYICYKCEKTLSPLQGSFLENLRASIRDEFIIIWFWCAKARASTVSSILKIDKKTIFHCYEFCQEIASWKLKKSPEKLKLGNVSDKIQIEEFNYSLKSEKIILCMYSEIEKRGFLEIVDDRNASTILPIIQTRVRGGSEIKTTSKATYEQLAQLPVVPPYIHSVVKRSSDKNINVDLQSVKAYWSRAKAHIRDFGVLGSTQRITHHIDTIMWRNIWAHNNNNNITFVNFLDHLKEKYPQK